MNPRRAPTRVGLRHRTNQRADIGGAALLSHFTGWSTSVPTATVALALGFSGAIGVFFGFHPARKAAALNPIQALRYE